MPLFSFVSPKEEKYGKFMVATPLSIQTSSSVEGIKQALCNHVTALPDRSELKAINAMTYIVSQTENQILYACGNKVNPKMFIAELTLKNNDSKTSGMFKILSHFEQNKVVVQIELMKKLRDEVRAAVISVDSSAIISE